MKNTRPFHVFVCGLFFALLAEAFSSIPAFADEGDPPTDPFPSQSSDTEEQGSTGEDQLQSSDEESTSSEESGIPVDEQETSVNFI